MKIHGVTFGPGGKTYRLSFGDQDEAMHFTHPSTTCYCNSVKTNMLDDLTPVQVDLTIDPLCPWHTSWSERVKELGVDNWDTPPSFMPQPYIKAERFPVIPTVMR